MKKALFVALLVLFAVAGSAAAREITLTATQDACLYMAQPTTNNGTGGRMDVRGGQDGVLIQFNLDGELAAGEVITAAKLHLPYWSKVSEDFVAYNLLAPWQEGIGNSGSVGGTLFPWGPASVGDASWTFQASTAVRAGIASDPLGNTDAFIGVMVGSEGVLWNTPGGRGIGTDVGVKLLDVVAWTGADMDLDPAGVTVLNGWADGTVDNYGLNLWSNNGGLTKLKTIESGAGPSLVLTIVPEPMTIALLGIGGLALIRRRK